MIGKSTGHFTLVSAPRGKSSSLGNRNRLFFDPDLLLQGQSLQLEPWEYEKGGYFFELSEFLTENLPHFDFALPFISQPEGKKIGREPWHISYLPLAEQASRLFTPDVLLQVWQHETVAGKETLITHLSEIFKQYVV